MVGECSSAGRQPVNTDDIHFSNYHLPPKTPFRAREEHFPGVCRAAIKLLSSRGPVITITTLDWQLPSLQHWLWEEISSIQSIGGYWWGFRKDFSKMFFFLNLLWLFLEHSCKFLLQFWKGNIFEIYASGSVCINWTISTFYINHLRQQNFPFFSHQALFPHSTTSASPF